MEGKRMVKIKFTKGKIAKEEKERKNTYVINIQLELKYLPTLGKQSRLITLQLFF